MCLRLKSLPKARKAPKGSLIFAGSRQGLSAANLSYRRESAEPNWTYREYKKTAFNYIALILKEHYFFKRKASY